MVTKLELAEPDVPPNLIIYISASKTDEIIQKARKWSILEAVPETAARSIDAEVWWVLVFCEIHLVSCCRSIYKRNIFKFIKNLQLFVQENLTESDTDPDQVRIKL